MRASRDIAAAGEPLPREGNFRFPWTWADYLLPAALGVAAFFLVVGGQIVAPTNIGWMANGDPSTYYLSWGFFRDTPWALPPGANPNYGLGQDSAIFFGDAIPLAALVAKAFSPWLPRPFQYWGIWLLGCFILQAIFGWKLGGLITNRRGGRFLLAGLFVFSPPFLFRLSAHYSLCAQWLILAALYLCWAPPTVRRKICWPLLAFLAAGIHSYILAMIVALWLADAARRYLVREEDTFSLAREAFFVGIATAAMLWAGGFFMVHNGLAEWPLGALRMNLLSLINPSNSPIGGAWSYVLPVLPSGPFEYEGFNYAGLGLLFLLGVCLVVWERKRVRPEIAREWRPLLLVFAGLTLFAISNHIFLGPIRLIHYPLPHFLDALRSSGRMFWPVFYGGLFLAARFLWNRLGPRVATVVLAVALVVQVADTSAGWRIIRRNINESSGTEWASPMKAPFWNEAATRYRAVYLIPAKSSPDSPYQPVAYYAMTHGLATDAAYLARIDRFKEAQHARDLNEELASGKFEGRAFYILDAAHAAVAGKSLDARRDLLTQVDGFNVLAPGWKTFPTSAPAAATR